MRRETPAPSSVRPRKVGTTQGGCDAVPFWRRRWFSWPLAGLVVAGCAWGVSVSSLFAARDIEVTGTSHFAHTRILAIAGLGAESNVLWLDSQSIEARLEANPWIAGADLRRTLPDRLTIDITEQVPVARVQASRGWRMVGSDGSILGRWERGQVLTPIRLVISNPGPERDALVLHAAEALAKLPRSLRSEVSEALVDLYGSLVLELNSGLRVVYGGPGASSAKATAIIEVLGWARRHGLSLTTVDVRAPMAPSATPWIDASDPAAGDGEGAVTHGKPIDFPRSEADAPVGIEHEDGGEPQRISKPNVGRSSGEDANEQPSMSAPEAIGEDLSELAGGGA